MSTLVLLSVFVVATCGLIYELLAGTLASYLLGDSILQFSTVIGTYMFALGIGSWISKYVHRNLSEKFVQLQISVGMLGGLSATILFLTFGYAKPSSFRIALYLIVLLIGILQGLEIPLLLCILRDKLEFKELVSQVLALDYIGALLASVLFPLVLVPQLGLIRTACMFGIINVLVALAFLYLLDVRKRQRWYFQLLAWSALGILAFCFVAANKITTMSEEYLYSNTVIMTRQSPYQRLVLTRHGQDIRLYLNNNLQFSSKDEYRYHEALVHPALDSAANPADVLVLGGGDGLAAREILTNPKVKHLTLVDLDPAMTELFSTNSVLCQLNGGSLRDPRVKVVNDDAFVWLNSNNRKYDVIIVDFPDPSNFSVGKLYTTTFYHRLRSHLNADGACTIQCTSPLFARTSFWCINHTIANAGFTIYPYHVNVPSFGEWGFCLAVNGTRELPNSQGRRYLNPATTRAMFNFPNDMSEVPTEVNRLFSQTLVHYYDAEWRELAQ